MRFNNRLTTINTTTPTIMAASMLVAGPRYSRSETHVKTAAVIEAAMVRALTRDASLPIFRRLPSSGIK